MKRNLVSIAAAQIAVDTVRRQIKGTLYRIGEVGMTDAGPLRITAESVIELPADLTTAALTEDHTEISRGHLASWDDNGERVYVINQVAAGALGDAALADAGSRKRAGLSFLLRDAEITEPRTDGVPELIRARLHAIGQVEHPAFNSARIDQIAASQIPGANRITEGAPMNKEQKARLKALRALTTRTPEQETEFATLLGLAADLATADGGDDEENTDPAPTETPAETPPADTAPVAQIAAGHVPAIPSGVPVPQHRPGAQTNQRGGALGRLVSELTLAMNGSKSSRINSIAAALSDVTSTNHTAEVEPVGWSAELWSGLQYEPVFTDLLTPDSLTYWTGEGWRFTDFPSMADYAGDKAEIPSGAVSTEDSTFTAARMAVGLDIDRKFFDFPNEAFVRSLLERIRETWEIKLDAKARAFITTNAVAATRTLTVATTNGDATVTAAARSFSSADVGAPITGTGIPASTTILSVTNSGSIELSANATATGADVTATIDASASTVLKAAARVVQSLKGNRVGKASWIALNDEDMFTLLDVAEKDVSAFLYLWDIKPENFRSSADITPGTVLGGVKQAAKLRTLPGSPIRVDALDLAHGGVDEAFFGYWAIEQQHKKGIAKARFKV